MKEITDAIWGMHLLEIEITYRCNLNCSHCYNRNESIVDMPLNDILNLITTANKNHVQKLVISGGEACMHPNFAELCDYIYNNRESLNGIKSVVLLTNGLSSQCKDKHLRAFDTIHLSYDRSESTIRQIDADKQIAFAKHLQMLGIYVYLFVTITHNNQNQIDELVETANSHGIPIAFNLCTSNEKNMDYLLSKSEIPSVLQKLDTLQLTGKILPFKHPYMSILHNTHSDHYIGNRGGCTAGIASCTIKADGTVIPCSFLRLSSGNIYDDNLEHIWKTSENFAKIRNRALYEKCGDCKYVSYCGGCRKSAFDTSSDLRGFDTGCIFKES